MKNTKLFVTLLILVSTTMFISNCKKDDTKEPPVAEFSYSGDTQSAPTEIIFINSSKNANTFDWNFGDGATSTEQHPKHTFETSGTYTITLNVTGDGGNNTITKDITISNKVSTPVADFTFTGDNVTAPAEVTFSNSSTNATSYKWEFGDGETSTEENPKHTYAEGGTFTVKLTASNDESSNSTTKSIVLQKLIKKPVADFLVTGNYGTAPAELSFTNYSENATSYKWEFGDGATSTSKSPKHTYTTGGTFTVKLAVTGEGGTDTMTDDITIYDAVAKPVANFSFTGDNNFAPSKITFTNTSSNATSYSWDFGDGGTSTSREPEYVYSSGGIFNVTLTAKNSAGETNIINKTITIKNKPTKFKITSMILTGFPATEADGAGWDPFNGPDVQFKFSDDDGENYFETGYISDVTQSDLPLTFTTGFPITISALDFKYTIELWDRDSPDADDWMGGFYFTVRDKMPTNGDDYPTTIYISNSTNELKFTLNVEWLE